MLWGSRHEQEEERGDGEGGKDGGRIRGRYLGGEDVNGNAYWPLGKYQPTIAQGIS